MRLVLSGRAAADLDGLKSFLCEKDANIAEVAAAMFMAAMESLAAFPERGRPVGPVGMRELIVPSGIQRTSFDLNGSGARMNVRFRRKSGRITLGHRISGDDPDRKCRANHDPA